MALNPALPKKGPALSVDPVHEEKDAHDEAISPSEEVWHPGAAARFPYWGMAGLAGVLIAAASALVVLLCSDGRSETHWPKKIPPNVLLSGINTFSNLMLSIAVAQGVSIAWWRHALHGATIDQLHQSWGFSTSIKQIFVGWKGFNTVALAALAVKIAIMDGPLLQKATTTYNDQNAAYDGEIQGVGLRSFPVTSDLRDRGLNPASYKRPFNEAVKTWLSSSGFYDDMHLFFPGCHNSYCLTTVEAAGFEVTCTSNKTTKDFGAAGVEQGTAYSQGTSNDTSEMYDLPIFNTQWDYTIGDEGYYPYLTLNYTTIASTYEESDGDSWTCPGTYTQGSCIFRPAIIEYPLTVVNYTGDHRRNGAQLGWAASADSDTTTGSFNVSNKQLEGYRVKSYINMDTYDGPDGVLSTNTTIGGHYLALYGSLTSSGLLNFAGTVGWGLAQTGTLVQSMMTGQAGEGGMCNYTFSDPTSYLVDRVNQLAFFGSLLTSNSNYTNATTGIRTYGFSNTDATAKMHSITATITTDALHYKSHFVYGSIAIVAMVICVLCVAPSYYGYWELGRPVTLGPFEIANAFRAPVLQKEGAVGTGKIDDLIREIGDRKVQYGVVNEDGDGARARLAIAEEERVTGIVRQRF